MTPSGWSVTLNAIALLVVIAALVALLRGLGLTKRNEALGMPANSVRALLAFIVLIMLATLGTQFFNAMSGDNFTGLSSDEIDKLNAAGMMVVPLVRTEKASGDATYSGKILKTVPTEAEDLAKNISSGLLTLLTAIVSFYFGSQSAREGARTGADIAQSQSQSDGGTGQPDTPNSPNFLSNAAKNIAAGTQKGLADLGDNPMQLLKDALSEAEPSEAAKLANDLNSAQAALDKAKSAASSCQVHASVAASAATDAASAAGDSDKVNQAGARAKSALDDASSDAHAFELAIADFKMARDKILSATAKG